ncbi:uncharacterized protein LOC128875636 [Hylaeus volcanicus]|uniref:uncharacterized protein LOC128875636 n=1 Tax=Hylaeus volcanicus TaxID=313075 RepID=UPI0023B83443|nr:uncharacterized protein LOC128875636 [Hylaeus volcanicus]
MVLSRISSFPELLATVSRVSHAASVIGEVQCTRYAAVHQNRINSLHVTSVRRYPDPPTLPLPTNVSEIFANETGRFTPERSRDIAAPVLLYGKNDCKSFFTDQSTKSMEHSSIPVTCGDTHVDSYDCFGAISLNGTMQSNVPKPFCSSGKSTHLNMPGGQWARDGKYIAEDMQKSHYRSTHLPQPKLGTSGLASQILATTTLMRTVFRPTHILGMRYTTNMPKQSNPAQTADTKQQLALAKKERFRRIVKDYGSTVVVFHIGISLISLGTIYTAVISGLDLTPMITSMLNEENQDLVKILNYSSNFLLAYSIHKVFAPVRIAITFSVVPFLVQYLRRIGLLKPPKVKTN